MLLCSDNCLTNKRIALSQFRNLIVKAERYKSQQLTSTIGGNRILSSNTSPRSKRATRILHLLIRQNGLISHKRQQTFFRCLELSLSMDASSFLQTNKPATRRLPS